MAVNAPTLVSFEIFIATNVGMLEHYLRATPLTVPMVLFSREFL
jgi:hypothetical protein